VGRKAHDAKTLWLHGSQHGSQAAAPTESSVRAGRPKYPPGLTPAARRVFKELCRLLSDRRALSEADGEALRLYAILYDRHARALAAVEADGLLISQVRFGHNGEPSSRRVKHPALAICQESEKQMTAILRDLCLTIATKDKAKPTRARPAEELTDDEAYELWEAQQGDNQNAARRTH